MNTNTASAQQPGGNQAITRPPPRQVGAVLIPKAERISSQVARVLRHYVGRRDRNGQLRDIPLRAIYLATSPEDCYIGLEVDPNRLGPGVRLATLLEKDLLTNIRIATGYPVWVVEQNGLTYVLDLNPRPPAQLPRRIHLNLGQRPEGEYPIGLGQARSGPVWCELSDLAHIIAAGSSGSGKSAFLRSLVWQLHNQPRPVDLYLADLEGLTFAWAAGWPQLRAPIAQDVNSATAITRTLLAEIEQRAQLYEATRQFPESLAEYHAAKNQVSTLPWIVAVFDEFSALAEQAGKNSEFMHNISQLAQRSRKFGLTLVFAGQDFKADLLNTRITNQLRTRIQFRCAQRAQSEVVLGQGGAEKIKAPGRALVCLDGHLSEVQTYWIDKQLIIRATGGFDRATGAGPTLSHDERLVIEVLMKPAALGGLDGEFNINRLWEVLRQKGVSNRKIRLMRGQWLSRGWLDEQPAVTASSRVSHKFLDEVLPRLGDSNG